MSDRISIADAHRQVQIAALQKHLRDLRAEQVSLHPSVDATGARHLLEQINSALEVLNHLGAAESPAQP